MKKGWAYNLKHAGYGWAERWEGGYASRESAITAATSAALDYDDAHGARICEQEWPDPVDAFANAIDIERIFERMEEDAADNGYYCEDGPLFECSTDDMQAIVARIVESIAEELRQRVSVTTFTVDFDSAEEVEVPRG